MKRACRSSRFVMVWILLVVFSLFVVGCKAKPVGGPVAQDPDPPVEEPHQQEPIPPEDLSPITGMPLVSPGSPVAASIDNYPDARPQTGLCEADIVYEAVTEGGITRYLAIFHSSAPETIGPIRSARPYFALLAKEWDAVFAHCGGDPKDINAIKDLRVVDGDEFAYGYLYWRDTKTRKAPHNLYTSVENLRKVPSSPLPDPEQRYEFGSWPEIPEVGLYIRYNKDYAVEYRYVDEGYERYIIEKSATPRKHVDRETEAPIMASNVIVQFAKTAVVYSDGGVVIDLVGEGDAAFLLGGVFTEGRWVKETDTAPTLFYGPNGTLIEPAKGQTWVQIVPLSAEVKNMPNSDS